MSKWIEHIKSVRAAHKGMSYKEAMRIAAKTYKSSGKTEKVHHKEKDARSSSKKHSRRRRGHRGKKHRGGGEHAEVGAVEDHTEGENTLAAGEAAPAASEGPAAPAAHVGGGKRKKRKTRKRKGKRKRRSKKR